MPQDFEPTNGLGHYSCGLCSTYSQILKPILDSDGNALYDSETGLPLMELDQEPSSQEIRDHVEAVHVESEPE